MGDFSSADLFLENCEPFAYVRKSVSRRCDDGVVDGSGPGGHRDRTGQDSAAIWSMSLKKLKETVIWVGMMKRSR